MSVAPLYFIYNYLQKTNSWHALGGNNMWIQLQMKIKMRSGITSIMSFQTKNVDSYSMWKGGEASTWVTAFILRLFTQISGYLSLDKVSICKTTLWLMHARQSSDGSFTEHSDYIPKHLQGSLKKEAKDRTMYLTAFTSIAIQKAFDTCETEGIKRAIIKANEYLSKNMRTIKSTLSLAITAYALALEDHRSNAAYQAMEKLKDKAFVIGNPPTLRYWKDTKETSSNEVTARVIQTTSYVLLAVLLSTDKMYANPIVKWLTEKQRYGGGFISTQDTVTALEALTEYVIKMKYTKLDMSVMVQYKRLGDIQKFELNEQKAFTRPLEIEKNDNLLVTTTGRTGTATVNMQSVYYVIGSSGETCHFDLKIDATKATSGRKPSGVRKVYRLKACAKSKPTSEHDVGESDHYVMEITLNTGLLPDEEDLKMLLNGVDGLILDYRISDRSVILQINPIPSEQYFCVAFLVYEVMEVGMVTPSPFTVYSYHSPDKKCTIFYNVIGENKLLKLCHGEECKCMEAVCSEMQPPINTTFSVQAKYAAACSKKPTYAYKVQILSSEEQINFIKYNATIQDIYMKADAVEQNSVITLVKKDSCLDVTLTPKQTYLIMGQNSLTFISSRRFIYEYPLDAFSWIEMWPPKKECSESACEIFRHPIEDFVLELLMNGC